MTLAMVVDEFRRTYLVTEVENTTRKGYESVLQANVLPRFSDFSTDKVNGKAASDLGLDMAKRKLKRSTRRFHLVPFTAL